ncbi:hypothetical protein HMPREF9372_0001 [Sporosarcina newyorkensis 2681]|uniref:Uncharacterized protein n=1 Tax=Sporosarcina newyorkensis 2681 TaxID=1027292 RepID=F9DMH1_9BACL|nr:hypothetical protein HMPREF9372_0001 [Sporosarcina newyorkensis 2681]
MEGELLIKNNRIVFSFNAKNGGFLVFTLTYLFQLYTIFIIYLQ